MRFTLPRDIYHGADALDALKTFEGKKAFVCTGVGPVYVAVIMIMTVTGIMLSIFRILPQISFGIAKIPVKILGVLLILSGILLWAKANFSSKIGDHIKENKLVTDGIYAYTRNPIYSAFFMLCTGTLLIAGNVWLLILPPLFWLFLTILIKCTEEKWLKNLYGSEYEKYCRRVNRCIPWFPKKTC